MKCVPGRGILVLTLVWATCLASAGCQAPEKSTIAPPAPSAAARAVVIPFDCASPLTEVQIQQLARLLEEGPDDDPTLEACTSAISTEDGARVFEALAKIKGVELTTGEKR